MSKGIAEINVSDSDALRLKKINENFKQLISGETPVGAVSGTGGGYNAMVGRVGGYLGGNDRFVRTISAYAIDAKYISADTIDTTSLTTKYADIQLLNVGDLAAKNIWAKTMESEEVTAEDGYFTQILNAVKIQTSALVADSITADKLRLSSGVVSIDAFVNTTLGLFDVINKTVLSKQGINVSDRINEIMLNENIDETTAVTLFDNGIDGSALVVGSVTASKIKVSDLEAFHATIGGFHINDPNDTKGGLYANLEDGGKFEMRPDGYFRAGSASTYIEVDPDPDNGKLDVHCTTLNTQEDITVAESWKWDFVAASGAMNLLYIGEV